MRQRPLNGTGGSAGRQFPFDPRRLPGIARIGPIGVPARRDDLTKRHSDRVTRPHSRFFWKQRRLDLMRPSRHRLGERRAAESQWTCRARRAQQTKTRKLENSSLPWISSLCAILGNFTGANNRREKSVSERARTLAPRRSAAGGVTPNPQLCLFADLVLGNRTTQTRFRSYSGPNRNQYYLTVSSFTARTAFLAHPLIGSLTSSRNAKANEENKRHSDGVLPSLAARAKAQGGYNVLACADASNSPKRNECSKSLG